MDKIIKEHFWNTGSNGDVSLKKSDLGWPLSLQRDAQSDYPETIFRYVIEIVGYNLLFYWTKDENFYVIETEKNPIEVRRIGINPEWDGKIELFKADSNDGPNTSSHGELLKAYDDPTSIWGDLRINGVSIGNVIDDSLIITWD